MRTLTLRSDQLIVDVIPDLGAKISSLRMVSGGHEILQTPLRPYAPRTREMTFDQADASGIDECIPTVSDCEIELFGTKIRLPDHGDFWRIPFEAEQSANEIASYALGYSLPLRFEKRLVLKGNALRTSYKLTNTGEKRVPYLWSAHPGFAAEEGDRVVLPPSVNHVETWYSGNSRLGAPGKRLSWPRTLTASGATVDLSVVEPHSSGTGDKLFMQSPNEGWVALEQRRIKSRVEVHFEPRECPWTGLWLAYGGWPSGQALRQQCVAIEPCTAPADSLDVAIRNGTAKYLDPGARCEWAIEIKVVPA